MSEQCERTSERTSEWSSTYVSIPVCARPVRRWRRLREWQRRHFHERRSYYQYHHHRPPPPMSAGRRARPRADVMMSYDKNGWRRKLCPALFPWRVPGFPRRWFISYPPMEWRRDFPASLSFSFSFHIIKHLLQELAQPNGGEVER